ncbi:MAG TPA: hypothetical protein VNT30_18195 [Stellaceae bacterium]|nr:hypothetical protein [Stellaceae bacterium]
MPINDDMFEVELFSAGTWRIGARYDSAEAAKAEALRALEAGRNTLAVRVVSNTFDPATQVYKQVTILRRDRAAEDGKKAPSVNTPVDRKAMAERYEQRRSAVAKQRQAASRPAKRAKPRKPVSGVTKLCINTLCVALLIGILMTALNYIQTSLH